MLRTLIVLLLTILVASCATRPTPIPAPAPMPKSTNFCAPGETKDCRQWTADEKNGAAVRGHSTDTKDPL